jgi:Ca2+-binding RTX toxin-like protein
MALKGNDRDNHFFGTRFDDEIFGFGGNDEIDGSPGADRIDGGQGVDRVTYNLFSPPYPGMSFLWVEGDAVDVDLERATQFGGLAEGDVLIGIENVFGSIYDDTIRGDAAENLLEGTNGNDVLDGRDGNDRLDGGFDDDSLSGGIGNDLLFGGEGNDTLFGDAGADVLDGGAGVDTANYLPSSAGVVVLLDAGTGQGGAAAGDVLLNVENIVGSTFGDSLTGSEGINVLAGGVGNDVLAGLAGADTLNGGNGNDTATYAASTAGVIVDLALGAGLGGDATNDTLISIENLTGSGFADTLVGNDFANALSGGDGADRLIGGRGVDTLTGGAAGDTFVWRDIKESGTIVAAMDLIADFDPLEADVIDLSGVDANAIAAGNQAFTFIGAAGFSGTPGEINFIHINGETIIQLQTGVVGDTEMGIRIAGILTPEASWFVL